MGHREVALLGVLLIQLSFFNSLIAGASVKKVIGEQERIEVEVTTTGSLPVTGRDDITEGFLTGSDDQVVSDQFLVTSADDLPLADQAVVTTADDLPFADQVVVTTAEDLRLADEVPVTTEVINEADNEIDREERDLDAVSGTERSISVTNKENLEIHANDEEVQDEVTEGIPTTQLPFGIVDDGIFPPFSRPITPDPNADINDFSTVNPLPEEYDRNNLVDVNITSERVYGRASCQCGVPPQRIVGGELARISDLPWTVALIRGSYGGRPYCGGTLINNRYVLTASHCVDGMSASGISCLINEQDFNSNSESKTQRIGVAQIIMHPNYNRKNIDNDIALIKLASPVALSNTGPAIPICLPASDKNDFTDERATVAGWGTTTAGGSTSSHLRKVTVPVISNSRCNTNTKYKGKITTNMLCAGILETGGKDSCQGDSGGPLIIENGGRKTLIGVVSWGYGCAQPNSPGVYTRVARYPDWILANTRGAEWCQG